MIGMSDFLRKMTILSKIDGLMITLRRMIDSYLIVLDKISENNDFDLESLPNDMFENMKYIADDLVNTLDEYLQHKKTK